ncbi:hypothetical protein FISHEDRAFT_62959 [Fistulina hepatica ATCC 64428]|uniref:Ribosomal protein 60S n=1 Tax=Fistulina hepatica ATCC 64428 TaxID=1128425 RepID=A0A0D7A014_9AGAR|nr:hypothetical protein FISHEDRAFT_62959 [Fistulina hepatica ATCC 64428]
MITAYSSAIQMRYIAAYLLLQIGGNASPSAGDISKLLGAAGIEVDRERLDKLVSELKGKSIDELIVEGSSKLSSVPSGGAAVSTASAVQEESDEDMGFGLFD